jgi:hypothetical protein
MNRRLRRDRNAFLVFLAAVPIALLVALPLAVQKGNAYVAAKAQQNAATGATAPQKQAPQEREE